MSPNRKLRVLLEWPELGRLLPDQPLLPVLTPNAREGTGRSRTTNLALGFSARDYDGRRLRGCQLEMSR
jgi:hypothetical protein